MKALKTPRAYPHSRIPAACELEVLGWHVCKVNMPQLSFTVTWNGTYSISLVWIMFLSTMRKIFYWRSTVSAT